MGTSPRDQYRSVPIPKRLSNWLICFCWYVRDWNFWKRIGVAENWASTRYPLLSSTELYGKCVLHGVCNLFCTDSMRFAISNYITQIPEFCLLVLRCLISFVHITSIILVWNKCRSVLKWNLLKENFWVPNESRTHDFQIPFGRCKHWVNAHYQSPILDRQTGIWKVMGSTWRTRPQLFYFFQFIDWYKWAKDKIRAHFLATFLIGQQYRTVSWNAFFCSMIAFSESVSIILDLIFVALW